MSSETSREPGMVRLRLSLWASNTSGQTEAGVERSWSAEGGFI